MKNNKIRDDFTAQGIDKARQILAYDRLTDSEKKLYWQNVEERRIRNSEVDTAFLDGENKGEEKGLAKGEAERAQLKAECTQLKAECTQLKAESSQLKAESSQLIAESSQLKAESSQLKAESSQLKAELKEREEREAELLLRIATMEQQLSNTPK